MSFIKINFKQIIQDRVFFPLRNALNSDWHNVLISQVEYLYGRILNIRTNNLFLSNHTSQKISLEHLLNNITDSNGFKLVTGSPIYCETTGNTPISYFFTDDEDRPTNVKGYYTINNNPIVYNPVQPISWLDSELYDSNGDFILPYEEIAWMFTDEDVLTGGFTVYVDTVDFVGLIGYDSNNKPIYSPNSKLDIINNYVKQYTVVGVNYSIQKI